MPLHRQTSNMSHHSQQEMNEPLLIRVNSGSSSSSSSNTTKGNYNYNDSINANTSAVIAELDAPMLERLKYSCLVLGVLIGFFIQVSTIGASFLTNLPWSKATDAASAASTATSDGNIALYAFAWSVITATASCGVMMIFRSFVEITFNLTFGRAQSYDPMTHDRILDELIWYFECYFSLGVLISVTLAWVATSFVLGMPSTLVDLGITFALPIFWCVSFVVIFMSKEGETKSKEAPQLQMAKSSPALMLV